MTVHRIFSKLLNNKSLRTALSSLSVLVIGFTILGLAACSSPFMLTKYLDGTGETDEIPAAKKGSSIEITPDEVTLCTPSTITFTATGGTPPYDYTLIAGPGSIDLSSGVFSSGSGSGGTATIHVEDSLGAVSENNVEVVATGNSGLWISPASVTLMEGEVFEFDDGGEGTVPPYTYSIQPGGEGSIVPGTGVYTAPSPVTGIGFAVIEIEDGNLTTAQAIVKIVNPSEGYSITQSDSVIQVGESVDFEVTGASRPVDWDPGIPSSPPMMTPADKSTFTPTTSGVAQIVTADDFQKIVRLVLVVDP